MEGGVDYLEKQSIGFRGVFNSIRSVITRNRPEIIESVVGFKSEAHAVWMKLIYLQHTEGININFSEKPTTPKQVFSSKSQAAADTVNHVLSFFKYYHRP